MRSSFAVASPVTASVNNSGKTSKQNIILSSQTHYLGSNGHWQKDKGGPMSWKNLVVIVYHVCAASWYWWYEVGQDLLCTWYQVPW